MACVAVVGALNQCLYLRRLDARAEAAADAASAPPAGGGDEGDEGAGEGAGEEEDFKFHLLAHCALDVIEERVGTLGGAGADGGAHGSGSKSSFLGLLFPTEEFRVYGCGAARARTVTGGAQSINLA